MGACYSCNHCGKCTDWIKDAAGKCTKCGQPLEPSQTACPKCGAKRPPIPPEPGVAAR